MTDRKTLDQLNSDDLDELYDRLAAEEADNEKLRRWLLRCSHREAIARVRTLADRWDAALAVDKPYARALRAALDEPAPMSGPAATQATEEQPMPVCTATIEGPHVLGGGPVQCTREAGHPENHVGLAPGTDGKLMWNDHNAGATPHQASSEERP